MEKKDENIIKTEENEEDDWESISENEKTEENKDILHRLSIEKAAKVKLDIHKLKNYHSIKVKKLEKKEIESFYDLDAYIKEKYLPNISINNISNSNPYISILNTDYILKKNPEIGTYLIYELDDEKLEANLIGKSDTWYEATFVKPKSTLKKPVNLLKTQNKKFNKGINFIKKNIVKNSKNENNNISKLLNKKRKRRRKKRKYPKDSTVIEIKRIFDNKEKDKEDNDKANDNSSIDNNKKNEENIKIEK
jgi:hypothetical protein